MGEFVVQDNEGIRWIPVAGQMMIGRSQHSDLVLRSAMASRRHAWVWPHKDRVVIEDLGSTNGTFVNGHLLKAPRFLYDRDVVVIGNTQLTFLTAGTLSRRGSAATQPGSPSAWGADQAVCAQCGVLNHPRAATCTHCGYPLAVLGASASRSGAGDVRVQARTSATPTSPVVARPFPQAPVRSRSRAGRGLWIWILLLAILATALLVITGMLAVYTLT